MNFDFATVSGDEKYDFTVSYASGTVGTTDDFWEDHVFDSDIYKLSIDGAEAGFAGVGSGLITSFRLSERFARYSRAAFAAATERLGANGALAASCDDALLALSLERAAAASKNVVRCEPVAIFFRHIGGVRPAEFADAYFRRAEESDADDLLDKGPWVSDFIRQGKYYVMRGVSGEFLGQGFYNELRFKRGFASIGMEVAPDKRRMGVGRSIIMRLAGIARERGMIPVCGCGYGNVNSRLTLESAGFASAAQYFNIAFVY